MNRNTKIIELRRGGCYGDLIMLTALLPELKRQGYRIRISCFSGYSIILQNQPHIDEIVFSNYQYNNIEPPERIIDLKYPLGWDDPGLMNPVIQQHILSYWCQLVNIPITHESSIHLSEDVMNWAQEFSNYIIIQPTTSAPTPYRNWSIDRWVELVNRIQKELGFEVRQIGSSNDLSIPGVTKIESPSILHGIAALKVCRLFIGIESSLNHATQAVKKKSIILWGSTNPLAFGYTQNINLVNGVAWNPNMGNEGPLLSCQPCYRGDRHLDTQPCPYTVPDPSNILRGHDPNKPQLHACMAGNTVFSVFHHVRELLEETKTNNTFSSESYSLNTLAKNNHFQAGDDIYPLAKQYFSLDDMHKAKEYYQKRIELGGSEDDIYYSLLQLGVISVRQNDSEDNVLKAFMTCHNYRPTRAEALHQLAVYYRNNQNYDQGYLYAKEASKIPCPDEGTPHLAREVYDYQITDELQICAWWIGKYQESYELGQALLKNPSVPQSELPRIRENLVFAEEKMGIVPDTSNMSSLEATLRNFR